MEEPKEWQLNSVTETQQTYKTVKRTATAQEWYSILGHASNKAIQHLDTAAQGVHITNKEHVKAPNTSKCESCALLKAYELISRSPEKSENSDKPFYRITYDLIQFSAVMNGDEWVSHLACFKYNFNLIFTHKSKAEAVAIIRKGLAIIENRYGGKPVFIRADKERALGKTFETLLAEKGITYEPSAPYTQAQNGHSERMGRIMATKARAMRIHAKLPHNMWHEAIKAASYIANRTPTKRNGWKTPFECITGTQPDLRHLHVYECKAYALNKNIPRKEKLQERAHIGYLIDYNSTNIFRIWIPSRSKVIRSRDVLFNEDTHYKPEDLNALQIVSKPILEITYDI